MGGAAVERVAADDAEGAPEPTAGVDAGDVADTVVEYEDEDVADEVDDMGGAVVDDGAETGTDTLAKDETETLVEATPVAPVALAKAVELEVVVGAVAVMVVTLAITDDLLDELALCVTA